MGTPFSGRIDRDRIVSRIESHPLGDRPSERRAAFARLALGDDAAAEGRQESVAIDGEGGSIVYFHGGGYEFGSPRTHARIGEGLAERTGLRVALPAYPLAPERRWPAQFEAALDAAGAATPPLVLAGDSAGGHLALVVALELARRGERPAGLILFSPNTDRTGASRTRERNDPLDPMVDDADDRALAEQCFGDMPADDPRVSPLLDDLTLLPPLHLEVGREEVLLDDGLLLARRAWESGVAVTLHVQPDGLHMGQLWAPWWPVASESLARAALFARSVTGRLDGG